MSRKTASNDEEEEAAGGIESELAKIHPSCVYSLSSGGDALWKVMFVALLFAILTYYGTWQLLSSLAQAVVNMTTMQVVAITAAVFIVIYIIFVTATAKLRQFNLTFTLVVSAMIVVTSYFLSTVSLLSAEYMATPYDFVLIFIILFPVNVLIVMASFWITKQMVCRPERNNLNTR